MPPWLVFLVTQVTLITLGLIRTAGRISWPVAVVILSLIIMLMVLSLGVEDATHVD